MRPLPYEYPAAGAAFVVACALFAAVHIRVGISSVRSGEQGKALGTSLDRRSLLLVGLTSTCGVATGFFFAMKVHAATIAAGLPAARWIVFSAGIALIVAGSLLRQWAISTLGASFTFDVRVAVGQKVVTGGPYRWVRHPSYTAVLLAFAGIGLALGNWLALLAIVVLPAIGLVRRIFVEEDALLTRLGEPYRQYSAGKKRLVPGIW